MSAARFTCGATVVVCGVLAACNLMPGQTAAGGSAAPPDGNRSSGAAAGGRTATTSAGTPQQGTSAGGKASAEGSIKVGTKTTVMSSFEGDLLCSRLVAPFDLSDNFNVLSDMAVSGASSSFSTWLDQMLNSRGSSSAAADKTLNTARQSLPREVRLTALRMNWLPMSAERLYGRMVLDKMKDDLVQRTEPLGKRLYPTADDLLAEVLKGVDEPHDYQFELHIRQASGDNAMALPGGLIVVDAGLVRSPKTRDKAYFAIAHEIGHVLQRHETRAVQARIIDTVALGGNVADLVRAMRLTKTDPQALFAVVLAGKLTFERHYASQELHADGCAVRELDHVLANDGRLVVVVQSFVNQLTKDPPEPATKPAVDAKPAAPASTKPAAGPVNTAQIERTAKDVDALVTVVSRPIDRHPTSQERIDNLNNTLADIRKRPKKAGAAAPAASAPPAAAGKVTPPRPVDRPIVAPPKS